MSLLVFLTIHLCRRACDVDSLLELSTTKSLLTRSFASGETKSHSLPLNKKDMKNIEIKNSFAKQKPNCMFKFYLAKTRWFYLKVFEEKIILPSIEYYAFSIFLNISCLVFP